ncbi:hypothetical protein PAPHI01_0445 [Pancytospora philotis]|nr:hypothetical protein PAPHI01_0445 [Pancytospora philotis]
MESMPQLHAKQALGELFFALSGFETDSVHYQSHAAAHLELYIAEQYSTLFEPFRLLILRFLQASRHPAFSGFIAKYLVDLCRLRDTVQSVEELYVALAAYQALFQDIAGMIESRSFEWNAALGDAAYTRSTRRPSLLPLLSNSSDLTVNFESLNIRSAEMRAFLEQRVADEFSSSVEAWMNDADPTALVEVRSVDGFGLCMWSDMFALKGKQFKGEAKRAVLESGKIVHFIRTVFGAEAVADGTADGGASAMAADPLTDRTFVDPPMAELAASAKLPFQQLPPFRYGDSVLERQLKLKGILNSLILQDLKEDIAMIYEIMLVQNYSFYLEILSQFEREMLETDSDAIAKINAFISDNKRGLTRTMDALYDSGKGRAYPIACRLSTVSLPQYILRLLEAQPAPPANPNLTVLQRFTLACSSSYLGHFISEKTAAELKILNRFLFLVSASMFYMERSPRHAFLQIVYALLLKIKDIDIFERERQGGHALPAATDDLQALVAQLHRVVARLLEVYSLTCAEVFVHWTRLFDLVMEYVQIEHRESVDAAAYMRRTREIVEDLHRAMMTHSGENAFTEYIGRLNWERYQGTART